MVEFLEEVAYRFSDRPALLFKTGLRYRRWSYRGLLQDSGRLASELQRRGVAEGDRVLVWGPNCPQWVLAFFACLRVGAVVVPLDVRGSPDFAHDVATQTDPRLLFASRVTPSAYRQLGLPTVFFEEMEKLLQSQGAPTPVELRPDDLAEVMFTSGTTGNPKGVMLTHKNLMANLESVRQHIPGEPSYRLVSILPLSHMFEQVGGLLIPLSAGANVTYPASLKPVTLLKTLAERRATLLLVVPQALDLLLKGVEREVSRQGRERVWRLLLNAARFAPYPVRRLLFRSVRRRFGGALTHIVAGGAALDPHLGAKWAAMGFKLIQGYGATEASPVISCHTIRNPRYDSAGPPIPGVDVRIASDGEIMVRGPNLTPGYWKAPEQTARVFTDGWYHTGDQGFLDENGFIHVNGRKKDMIVLANGQNVFPEDVEATLQRHPAVEDAAVVGVPRDTGTEVHAALRVDNEAAARDAVTWANGTLAEHQQIRGFTIWPQEDFPRTHTFKVKKGLVLEAVMASPSGSPPRAQQPVVQGEPRSVRQVVAEVAELDAGAVAAGHALDTDLGLDSLGRVELLSLIEQELGVYVDETEVAPSTTVAEIERLVEGRTNAVTQETAALSFPRWPMMGWCGALRALLQTLLAFPLFSVGHRSRVSGLEHLRGLDEPAIYAINHNITRWDTSLLLKTLPRHLRRRLAYAAAAEVTFGSVWKGPLASLLLNAFPLYRQQGVRASLEHIGRLLDDGWSIGIFPEGAQEISEEMLPFQAGTGLLAVECRAPVVPVRISGDNRSLWPPRRKTLAVTVGEPLTIPAGTSYPDATTSIEQAVKTL
ncbi:MAG: AMP-binding protein [Actinomycetia bacterium]|nr:AMP-binding protein [Actinomycetes bacterium]